MPIIEQTSVSFKSAERIGSENRFLDGRTADPVVQVGLAPNNVEPFTGTRWLVRPNFSDGIGHFLQCLGDVDGPRYLDGNTVTGTVGLAHDTNLPFTGTRWEVVDTDIDGIVNLFCRGDRTDGLNARFLAANSLRGTVGLVQDPGDATRWAIVDAQPEPVGGLGVTSARSTSSPSLAVVDPGQPLQIISMAYRGTDDRISIMWGFIGDVFTLSLANKCIDRPALGLDEQTHKFYLAWTALDQSINVMSSDDGQIFSGRTRLPGTSIFGPAITGVNGTPVVLWTDAETCELKMMNGLDAPVTTFAPEGPAETSSAAPALTFSPAVGGQPVIAWTGTDGERRLNVYQFGVKTTFDSSGPTAATSMSGPSLAYKFNADGPGPLFMGWTGLPGGPDHDNHPNIIFSQGLAGFIDRTTLAPVSDVAPAILDPYRTPQDHDMLIAWVDRQSQINLANPSDLPTVPA